MSFRSSNRYFFSTQQEEKEANADRVESVKQTNQDFRIGYLNFSNDFLKDNQSFSQQGFLSFRQSSETHVRNEQSERKHYFQMLSRYKKSQLRLKNQVMTEDYQIISDHSQTNRKIKEQKKNYDLLRKNYTRLSNTGRRSKLSPIQIEKIQKKSFRK